MKELPSEEKQQGTHLQPLGRVMNALLCLQPREQRREKPGPVWTEGSPCSPQPFSTEMEDVACEEGAVLQNADLWILGMRAPQPFDPNVKA